MLGPFTGLFGIRKVLLLDTAELGVKDVPPERFERFPPPKIEAAPGVEGCAIVGVLGVHARVADEVQEVDILDVLQSSEH